jgi:ABC-2 type transport system permease protein
MIRVPMFAISLFVLPAMLYALFVMPAVDDIQKNGVDVGQYTMPSFSIYVVMTTGVFSAAIGIASERSMKWNLLLRATPMRPINYFAAKFAMAYLTGFGAVAFLFIFARLVAGVAMSLTLWLQLLLIATAAMTPFIAIGLWLGYAVGPQAAAGLSNLIVLPLSFMSGLFVPVDDLPQFVQDHVAPYMPSYHAGQLGWHLVGAGDSTSVPMHVLWLVGFTAVFIGLAIVFYRRDEGKTYG